MRKICCRERPMVSLWFWTVFLILLNIIMLNGFSVDKLFEFILLEMLGELSSACLMGKSTMWRDPVWEGTWLMVKFWLWMVRRTAFAVRLTVELIQIRLMPFLQLLQPWADAGRRRSAVIIYSIKILCIWLIIICKNWLTTSLI